MLVLKDKIVFITGASSGIGKACAQQFAALGARLILIARRIDKLRQIAQDLKEQYDTDVLSIQLDVRNYQEVKHFVETLEPGWKDIYLLINNAGLALSTDLLQEGNSENWDTMIDTNVKGLLYVTRSILPIMVARNSGHIINIGSVAGHDYYPRGNVYSATKHAVKAISQSLRLDLLGTAIRVTEIAPGAVETEFSEVRWNDKDRADAFYADFEPLIADDIADAAVYCATRPLHVDISQLQITPTCQASANHLARSGTSAHGTLHEK